MYEISCMGEEGDFCDAMIHETSQYSGTFVEGEDKVAGLDLDLCLRIIQISPNPTSVKSYICFGL